MLHKLQITKNHIGHEHACPIYTHDYVEVAYLLQPYRRVANYLQIWWEVENSVSFTVWGQIKTALTPLTQ